MKRISASGRSRRNASAPARKEERVVLAPYGEHGGLVLAEILMELRIGGDVRLVVAEPVGRYGSDAPPKRYRL